MIPSISVDQILNFFEERMLAASHATCCEILRDHYYPWQSGQETFREVVTKAITYRIPAGGGFVHTITVEQKKHKL